MALVLAALLVAAITAASMVAGAIGPAEARAAKAKKKKGKTRTRKRSTVDARRSLKLPVPRPGELVVARIEFKGRGGRRDGGLSTRGRAPAGVRAVTVSQRLGKGASGRKLKAVDFAFVYRGATSSRSAKETKRVLLRYRDRRRGRVRLSHLRLNAAAAAARARFLHPSDCKRLRQSSTRYRLRTHAGKVRRATAERAPRLFRGIPSTGALGQFVHEHLGYGCQLMTAIVSMDMLDDGVRNGSVGGSSRAPTGGGGGGGSTPKKGAPGDSGGRDGSGGSGGGDSGGESGGGGSEGGSRSPGSDPATDPGPVSDPCEPLGCFPEEPAPENTSAPTLSGSSTTGGTVTCNAGTWSGADSFTYQWQRGVTQSNTTTWSNITGDSAGNGNYATTSSDTGNQVRCVVTGHNASASTQAYSNAWTITSGGGGGGGGSCSGGLLSKCPVYLQ